MKKARFWQNSNWRFSPHQFLLVVIHSNHQDQQWSLFFEFNWTKQVSHLESIICSKSFEHQKVLNVQIIFYFHLELWMFETFVASSFLLFLVVMHYFELVCTNYIYCFMFFKIIVISVCRGPWFLQLCIGSKNNKLVC